MWRILQIVLAVGTALLICLCVSQEIDSARGQNRCAKACPNTKRIYNFTYGADWIGTRNGKIKCRCVIESKIIEIDQ